MSKTLATLDEVKGSLPNPELYVILNGQPTKDKVVWHSLVNVDKVIQKLKDINWIYKDTDVDSVDDATKEVTTDSTMLEKATKEEIVGFQMFTIRTWTTNSPLNVILINIRSSTSGSNQSVIGKNIWMSCVFQHCFLPDNLVNTILAR